MHPYWAAIAVDQVEMSAVVYELFMTRRDGCGSLQKL